jgi:hypothetical protein
MLGFLKRGSESRQKLHALLCLVVFATNPVWAQAAPTGDNAGMVCPNLPHRKRSRRDVD